MTDADRPAKVSAQSILGTPRRPITRYRPGVIAAAAGGLMLLIGLGFLIAFGGRHERRVKDSTDATQAATPAPVVLDPRLPASYDDPLAQRQPGDAAMAAAAPPPPEASRAMASPQAGQRMEDTKVARASGPFFGGPAPTPTAATQIPAPGAMATPAPRSAKEQFLAAAASSQDYIPHLTLGPLLPYEVKAGTVISAALVTALNSDLPGPVIAQVTEPVFDHATGQVVLIPQGARLVGRYDSELTYGQDRVLVAWTRIVFPDGRSLNIGAMIGADATGAGGLTDRVEAHAAVLARAIGLSTLISIGGTAAQNGASRGAENLVLQDAAGGIASSASQVGQQLVDRDLQRAPTLRVRAGWTLRVLVDKDLVVAP